VIPNTWREVCFEAMTEPRPSSISILLVEDSANDAELVRRELRRAGLTSVIRHVQTEADFIDALGPDLDVILADFDVPGFGATRALELVQARGLDVPLIVVSGSMGEDTAVRMLQSGAADYLLKDRLARLGLAVTRAIAERRRRRESHALEEQYRQAQKMEAVGLLAGGVAHDFNNLLTVIQGFCSLVIEGTPAESPFGPDLLEIQYAANRAAALTQQLLAFSRKQKMEPRVLDLRDSLRSVGPMLRRLIPEDVAVATKGEPNGRVRADPGQVEQVLVNLAVNARDAMPRGGTLLFHVADADLPDPNGGHRADVPAGRYVWLAVSDTGIGMDEAITARIFEPFFTTKPTGQGTGLGLSTVYGIVKQSGGHVSVESHPGRGTTFNIYLPRVDEPVERCDGPVPSAFGRGTETVLVAEDEESVRRLIVRVLEAASYRVLPASTPLEALEIAENLAGPIHMLLSDVVMPHMTGPELAERIVAIRPNVRVIYMSGYTDTALVGRSALRQDVQLIKKPFAPDLLVRKVREAFDIGMTNPTVV
jgi:two-component system, cell cycle sensor histidine kinase and response regulator CckA